MVETALIFDANNLMHRSYHRFSNFTDISGRPTSVIYGVPFVIESQVRKFQPDLVIAVFDGSRSKHRLKLCPEYKGSRTQKIDFDREDFLRQRDEVLECLHNLGISVVYNEDQEADDMIYSVVKLLQKQNVRTIIIISSDKDFNQLATTKDVVIYNPHNQEKITVNTCKHFKGYEAKQTVDYLTLVGDDSDNIKGYPLVGEKRAIQFLEKYGSIKKFLREGESNSVVSKNALAKLYKKNHFLISLKAYHLKFMRDVKINWYKNEPFPKPNKTLFESYCGSFTLKSFLKDKNFYETFKNLSQRSIRSRKNNIG